MSRASLTQVSDRERAFAKTMADRDHAAFASFLSDEAVFMSDGQSLRGKQAVAAGWKRFYDAPQARLRLASSRLAGALAKAAPFSWEPDRVEVLDSGSLALSSGPVRDPQAHASARSTPCGGARRTARGRSCSTKAARRAIADDSLTMIREIFGSARKVSCKKCSRHRLNLEQCRVTD
jgi:hypothetical protein